MSADDEKIIPEIIKDLSKYDCDYVVDKHDELNAKYTYVYDEVPLMKLGERNGKSVKEYKNDMSFYNSAGKALISYGISPDHKGFRYAIESIRLLLVYGNDEYRMDHDVYPVISEWYNVSPGSVEHNIRNSIGNAWKRNFYNTEVKNNMSIFAEKPSNIKFLRHLAKITNYNLYDANIETI